MMQRHFVPLSMFTVRSWDIHRESIVGRPQLWKKTSGRKTYVHQAMPANPDRKSVSSLVQVMGISESSFDYLLTNERRCEFQLRGLLHPPGSALIFVVEALMSAERSLHPAGGRRAAGHWQIA